MMPNKTIAALFLLILNVQPITSTTPVNIQEPSSPGQSVIRGRKQRSAFMTEKNVLRDMDNTVNPVKVQERSVERMGILQESASSINKTAPVLEDTTNIVKDVLPINNQVTITFSMLSSLFTRRSESVTDKFARLIRQKSYWEICKLGKSMTRTEFLKQLYSVLKTLEQYNGIVDYLKNRRMVTNFYVYGDIGVVKEAIVESEAYDRYYQYVENADFEAALPLAFKTDQHDRFIDLLVIKKGITIRNDEWLKQMGRPTSFDSFTYRFIRDLAPWKDGRALRRFITLRGDEIRDKDPDIFDTLCQKLVGNLGYQLPDPSAEKLLNELIGQSSLLTVKAFARGLLRYSENKYHSAFITHGWREAIKEGLMKKYEGGGEKLWEMMKEKNPSQFNGACPDNEEALAAVLAHFPTKQELEDDWNKKSAAILFSKFKSLEYILNFFPNVLWSIIFEYTILWTDI